MEQSEIKTECEMIYDQMESAKKRLEELRKICKHTTTHEGMFSWRPGSISPAEICSDCGEFIKHIPYNV